MKYVISMEFDLDRERFLEYFQDIEFMKKWQPTLKSLDVISSNPGEVGSKSILKYEQNGKPSEIEEEIIRKDLPNDFDFIYRAGKVKNFAYNHFEEIDGKTIWTATHIFKFKGSMKILGLMKKAFVRQTTSDMSKFKEELLKL